MKAYFINLNPWASQENYTTSLKTLSGRFQKVILNGKHSYWKSILAGVPQGSISGPPVFLIYINDLPNELKSNAKLFADDTSLFTIAKDISESASILNNDLLLISKWAYNWKILFNPDPTKLAHEVIFAPPPQKKRRFKLIQS